MTVSGRSPRGLFTYLSLINTAIKTARIAVSCAARPRVGSNCNKRYSERANTSRPFPFQSIELSVAKALEDQLFSVEVNVVQPSWERRDWVSMSLKTPRMKRLPLDLRLPRSGDASSSERLCSDRDI